MPLPQEVFIQKIMKAKTETKPDISETSDMKNENSQRQCDICGIDFMSGETVPLCWNCKCKELDNCF